MLLDVDDAIGRLHALIQPIDGVCEVDLASAKGRIAAAILRAPIDLPPFDASAMDGYAVQSSGCDHGGEKRWRVVDSSFAGRPATKTVREGEAIRVFTGAVMPAGADAVVLQEDVKVDGDAVVSDAPVRPDQHVRHRGHDVAAGAPICPAGRRLTSFDLAWLSACGIASVQVARRVRVAVFSTGDELAEPGMALRPGQIYDSNRFALASLMSEKPVAVRDLGCLPDDRNAVRAALLDAAADADVIVTSGGVSVGEADYVKDVVEEIGKLDFWRLALKPGKPLAVGRIDRGNPVADDKRSTRAPALFFGLPGNPVSTIVTYLLFVAPAIDALAGATPSKPLTLAACATAHIRHSAGRREYMRGTLVSESGRLTVSVTGDQGSNRLATFADANCLVVIDADVGDVQPGETVQVLPLSAAASHLLPSRP